MELIDARNNLVRMVMSVSQVHNGRAEGLNLNDHSVVHAFYVFYLKDPDTHDHLVEILIFVLAPRLTVKYGEYRWYSPTLDALVVHSRGLPAIAERKEKRGVPFFIRNRRDEEEGGPIESCLVLQQSREGVGRLEIAIGDRALEWSIDDRFFDGFGIWRDRCRFRDSFGLPM